MLSKDEENRIREQHKVLQDHLSPYGQGVNIPYERKLYVQDVGLLLNELQSLRASNPFNDIFGGSL